MTTLATAEGTIGISGYPPFTGDSKAKCVKCGNGGYGPAGVDMTYEAGTDTLKRSCGRCGYTWQERALDA